jgi:peptide/nickel transport system permease protein
MSEQETSKQQIESPFKTVSDTEVSRSNVYRRKLDTQILAPLRIVWSDLRARVGVGIIFGFVLVGTIGVSLVPYPSPNDGPRLLGPFQSLQFPLGTDALGQGIFAQIIHATPEMLEMVLAGAVFSSAVATVVGTVSGYKLGTVDRILMTFTDIMLTIPGLPLTIILVVLFEPQNPFVIGLVLTVNAWAGLARSIRSQVLTIRKESYVEASQVIGAPTSTVLRRDIIPGLMPYILINFMQSGRRVIFSAVGLYFLGILPGSNDNWGVMMNLAYNTGGALYTWSSAHWLIFPMVAISLLTLGLILVSQGTDRLFNPRVRARHAKTIAEESDSTNQEENIQ